jgi:TonB family protein
MPQRLIAVLVALSSSLASWAGCASSDSGPKEPRYTIIKPEDQRPAVSGVSPDKEAEVQLVLQQRDTSTRKCYQDVLNEKKDRAFQGTVKVLISLNTSGKATNVKVVGGTLGDPEVQGCLVETLRSFEYPQLELPGDVQYEFRFRPAY